MKPANRGKFRSQVFYKHKTRFLMLELALLFLVVSFLHFFNELIVFLLQTTAFILGASGAFSEMAKDLRERKLITENTMFSLAVVLAMVMGNTAEAVVATVFYEILLVYREYNDLVVKSSLGTTLKFEKAIANVIEDGENLSRSADEIKRGDLVFVNTGERILTDGIIKSGEAEIDVSDIYGESEYRSCKEGDKVISGSSVINGCIVVEASCDFNDTVFHKINKTVISCGKEPSNSERFLLSFLKVFPIAVLCGSVVFGFVVPAFGSNDYGKWIYRAVICIMVSVPYALIKSVPAAYVAGISNAARNGIIFKSANAVDTAADLSSVVYEKTGTLSTGDFTVVDIEPGEGIDVSLLLNMALCVLNDVETPVSNAIHRYAHDVERMALDENIEIERVHVGSDAFQVVLNGKLTIYSGSADFMDSLGVAVVPSPAAVSSVYFAAAKRYMGRIDLLDEQKNDSYNAVDGLKNEGVVNVAIITEDNTLSANRAGQEIGISEIYADCTVEDKIERIEYLVKLQNPTERLAYVCGYPYDTHIMKSADMGIIINGMDAFEDGNDISDAVVLKDAPSDVAKMISFAKSITKKNNENILVYIGVKALLIVLALTGAMSIWLAMLADSAATFFVLKNTSRLLREDEEFDDDEELIDEIDEDEDVEDVEELADEPDSESDETDTDSDSEDEVEKEELEAESSEDEEIKE